MLNQKTKILTASLVIIFGAVLLLSAGCAKNNEGATTAGKSNESNVPKSTGWSSDAVKCADLMAYTSWLSILAQRQDIAAIEVIQQKTGGDLNKYLGWDSYEDMQDTCMPISKQAGFMELMAKRMQDLGFVIK